MLETVTDSCQSLYHPAMPDLLSTDQTAADPTLLPEIAPEDPLSTAAFCAPKSLPPISKPSAAHGREASCYLWPNKMSWRGARAPAIGTISRLMKTQAKRLTSNAGKITKPALEHRIMTTKPPDPLYPILRVYPSLSITTDLDPQLAVQKDCPLPCRDAGPSLLPSATQQKDGSTAMTYPPPHVPLRYFAFRPGAKPESRYGSCHMLSCCTLQPDFDQTRFVEITGLSVQGGWLHRDWSPREQLRRLLKPNEGLIRWRKKPYPGDTYEQKDVDGRLPFEVLDTAKTKVWKSQSRIWRLLKGGDGGYDVELGCYNASGAALCQLRFGHERGMNQQNIKINGEEKSRESEDTLVTGVEDVAEGVIVGAFTLYEHHLPGNDVQGRTMKERLAEKLLFEGIALVGKLRRRWSGVCPGCKKNHFEG